MELITETHHILKSMWEDILLTPIGEVDANFFDLGGHSLLAIELVSQIEDQFHIDISMKDILENQTLESLTSFVNKQVSLGLAKEKTLNTDHSESLFPLSANQAHMWGLISLFPLDITHNISTAIRIKKKLNLNIITNVLNKIFIDNNILRTRFIKKQNKIFHQVQSPKKIDLSFIPMKEIDLKNTLNQEMSYQFDLEKDDLIRIKFYRINEKEFIFFFMAHHIVWDGLSNIIFLNSFLDEYQAQERGLNIAETRKPASYQEYVLNQFHKSKEAIYQEKLEFWNKKFKGIQAPPLIPRTFSGNLHQHQCDVLNLEITEDLLRKVETFVRGRSLSLYQMFFSCFHFLLYQRTNGTQHIIGTPVHGRNDRRFMKTLGCFINTLPILHQLDEEGSFKDNLKSIARNLAESFSAQEIPFDHILRKTDASQLLTHGSLFQTLFVYLDVTREMRIFEQDEFDLVKLDRKSTHCEIDFYLYKAEKKIDVVIEYRKNLFSPEMIHGLFNDFVKIISLVTENEDYLLKSIQTEELKNREEKKYLKITGRHVARNEIPHFLDSIFSNIALYPQRPAVIFKSLSMTYQQLGQRVDQLCSLLLDHKVGGGDVVGVYLERDEELIPSLLAILKIGACYLPLDPSFPVDRLKYMMKKSGSSFVLSSHKLENHFSQPTMCLVEDAPKQLIEPIGKGYADADSAYLLFTSGSTGNPKGVEVTHANISNFLASMKVSPGMNETDKLLSVTTISFDISVLEIFLPLTVGASLYLAGKDQVINPLQLSDIISKEQITVMQATPVTWRMLLKQDKWCLKNLKVLCGGEALDSVLAQDLLMHSRELWNMYGPTETTVWSSIKKIETNHSPISVGQPIQNTSFFILSDDLFPLAIGEKGKLFIGGEGVSKGYFKEAELTQSKFITTHSHPQVIYDTGDIAYYDQNGDVFCVGRADQQVKLRGYRIELGEIEERLLEVEEVFEAAVKVIKDDIFAFVALKDDRKGDDHIQNKIMNHLKKKLPPYMIVRKVVFVPQLAKTANGKIDRNKLQLKDAILQVALPDIANPQVLDVIHRIWKKHLGLEIIDLNESFFNLGGHSLIAVDVFNHINNHFQVNLDLSLIFDHHSIAKMAQLVEKEISKKNAYLNLNYVVKISGSNKIHKNIFCFHGVGGNVINYYPLASALDQFNFYGVQSSGLNGRDVIISSIADMARVYIEEIKKIQDHGPYILAGGSMGGMIAMEVAKQLVSAQEEVTDVYMFDTFGPDLKLSRDNFSLENLPSKILHKLCEVWKRKIFSVKLFAYTLKNKPIPHRYRFQLVEERNLAAMRSYTPQAYFSPVTLIRVKQSAGGVYQDPYLGWQSVIKGELRVFEIDGHHESFIETPHFLNTLKKSLQNE